MIPSLNAMKRASAYLRADIKQLECQYRLLDKIGLNRDSVEASNAMVDLMQVDQMLTDNIVALESHAKTVKARKKGKK